MPEQYINNCPQSRCTSPACSASSGLAFLTPFEHRFCSMLPYAVGNDPSRFLCDTGWLMQGCEEHVFCHSGVASEEDLSWSGACLRNQASPVQWRQKELPSCMLLWWRSLRISRRWQDRHGLRIDAVSSRLPFRRDSAWLRRRTCFSCCTLRGAGRTSCSTALGQPGQSNLAVTMLFKHWLQFSIRATMRIGVNILHAFWSLVDQVGLYSALPLPGCTTQSRGGCVISDIWLRRTCGAWFLFPVT